ncbi:MAG: hypothetical protein B6242_12185 [Anaerolineaceae bacterium 4572_78]|nr:MAG: hypothetical protein B6242_12185 [Anaerolineaceae bacterium 4572_78]
MDNYLPVVVYAVYKKDYIIEVEFDNGVRKAIDFEPWLSGQVFEPLKDKAYFKRFFIEGGTVAWPNEADIAPETLYEAQSILIEQSAPLVLAVA